MRNINTIILHSSATPEGRHHDADDIRDWHVEGNGWSDIGYHFVIQIDGTVEAGRPLEVQGAHTRGYNANSVGVCYIGGTDEYGSPKDTMTTAQAISVEALVCELREIYGDDVAFKGHNEFNALKACPCFDVEFKFDYLM